MSAQPAGRRDWRFWSLAGGAAAAALLVSAVSHWRDDILRTMLDPKTPYQTYEPPPAPDYAQPAAWALLPPARWAAGAPPADVFFVHPTTYDGGRHWNGPIDDKRAARILDRTMLPNYAGPFERVGRVFAPRYRQASLYSFLTLRDDAREARRFAYRDVEAAWRAFRSRYDKGRPLVIVGVEQGGQLTARLLTEVVAKDPSAMARLAGAYLIDTVVPAETFSAASPLPVCASRRQARCVVAWAVVDADDADAKDKLDRALVWRPDGQLETLRGRPALCVNPISATIDGAAPARISLGAANATGKDWGKRPTVMAGQVSARCEGGLLKAARPLLPMLQPPPAWAARLREPPYNLFWGDLEADAKVRVATLMGRPDFPASAPSIENSETVRTVETHRVGG
jgi:hypothetical protein